MANDIRYYFILATGWGTDIWPMSQEEANEPEEYYRRQLEARELNYCDTTAMLVKIGDDGQSAEQVFIPELEDDYVQEGDNALPEEV